MLRCAASSLHPRFMPLWAGQPLAYPTVQKTGTAAQSARRDVQEGTGDCKDESIHRSEPEKDYADSFLEIGLGVSYGVSGCAIPLSSASIARANGRERKGRCRIQAWSGYHQRRPQDREGDYRRRLTRSP